MVTIKIELSAGSSIENAFAESTRLAKMLNCYIDFDFNDVKCSSSPDGDPQKGVDQYYKSVNGRNKYLYANNY